MEDYPEIFEEPPGDLPAVRRRPVLPVLGGFAAGIALDNALTPALWVWMAAALVGMALLLRWRKWGCVMLMVAALGGLWHGHECRSLPVGHLSGLGLDGSRIYRVEGRVRGGPQCYFRTQAPSWRVDVEVHALVGQDDQRLDVTGGVTVFVGGGRPDLAEGDRVQFYAKLRGNAGATNPGERDRALGYARSGSHATASVPAIESMEVKRPAWYGSVPIAVGRLRRWLNLRLDACLDGVGGDGAGLVKALVLGRRDSLTTSQRDLLMRSGTLHFLAISGLHVGVFCVLVSALLAMTRWPVRLRTALVIVLVWVYVLLTGGRVSALRAGWMLSFMLAAPLVGRRHDVLSGMAVAALLILLARPAELFSAGFQLTFVAVWALVVVCPQMEMVLWPWKGVAEPLMHDAERTIAADLKAFARGYLLMACTVWLVTMPILLWHFHVVSFVTPLLSLLLWPLIAMLLVACFVLLAVLPLGPVMAGPVAMLAMLLGGAVLTIVRVASDAPGFGVWLPAPALWWLALWYVTLMVWSERHRLARGRAVFLACVLLLAVGLIGGVVRSRAPRGFELTVCDIGPGQAVLMRLPGGHNLMLDAGARSASRQEVASELLWHSGVSRLDAVVLSHYDADHCNFVPSLLDRFRVRRVVVRQVVDLTDGPARMRRLLADAAEAGGARFSPISQAAGGIEAPGMTCRVLHPNTEFLGRSGSKSVAENDRSLVLMIECEGVRILFTGDIGSLAMRRLSADYGPELHADVLMLPHHGDFREGLAEFVAHVQPAVAIVSGTEQTCDPGTHDVLADLGVALWMTGREGAIIVEARDGRAVLRGWQSGRTETFLHVDD